jgi:hypothetical protein
MTSSASLSLSATSGSASLPSATLTKSFTNTGADLAAFSQAIGTSYEQLATPADLSYPAHLLITNDSGSGTISVAVTAADMYRFAFLAPGASILIPSCPANPYLKGDVACQIAVRACEE